MCYSPKDHVIVKGWHDSGSIDAIYGPYTEECARWLNDEFELQSGSNNWTVMKLSDFAGLVPPLPRDVQEAIDRLREDDYYVPGGSGLAQLDGETLADYIEGKS